MDAQVQAAFEIAYNHLGLMEHCAGIREGIRSIESLGLDHATRQKVFSGNAKRLLTRAG